jgi:hypothetical protein
LTPSLCVQVLHHAGVTGAAWVARSGGQRVGNLRPTDIRKPMLLKLVAFD